MVQLTDDQRAIQQVARDFAQREVAPISQEYQRRRSLPPGIVRRMGEQGLIGIMFPEKFGGAGGDVTAQALAVQEISKVDAGIGATLLVQVLSLFPIWKLGSEELKNKYLPKGIKGEIIGAIGMTEPDAGSDFASIQTRAVKDGDHYVVNGRKTFITNGPVADFVALAVKTAPEQGRRGISLAGGGRRHAGLRGGPQTGQDGLAYVGNRRAGVHGLPRARVPAHRRGKPRLLLCHGGLQSGADILGRPMHRHRRGGVRGGPGLRPLAAPV